MEHMKTYNYSLIAIIDNKSYKQKYCPDIGNVPLGAVWEYNNK